MGDIKAIQTEYKGYNFRSRLEARWAVFLDALGVPFEYEKEGYDLGEAGWYLPDFWLPQSQTWIEIKPKIKGVFSGFAKVDAFANQMSSLGDWSLALLFGSPYPWDYFGYVSFHGSLLPFPTLQFAQCCHPPCRAISLLVSSCDGGENLGVLDPPIIQHACSRSAPTMSWEMTKLKISGRTHLDNAYRAARSARFEHGQKGRTL